MFVLTVKVASVEPLHFYIDQKQQEASDVFVQTRASNQ